jgi:RNA polymerase sigma-70 factor (sigma-E family)
MADRAEFDAFVAARSQRLLRTAYLLTGDWPMAEDLLQTALAKCWFAWPRISGSADGYVRRTLVNTYATWWRRKWKAEWPTAELPERSVPDGTSVVDERDKLWRALARLTRLQRAVIVLRYYEDLPEAEIATALGISAGTVKSTAARALAALRRHAEFASTDPPDEPAPAAAQNRRTTIGGAR